MFNYDENVCGMHDCDEIGESVIIDLTRERKKVEHFLSFSLFKHHINSCLKNIFCS